MRQCWGAEVLRLGSIEVLCGWRVSRCFIVVVEASVSGTRRKHALWILKFNACLFCLYTSCTKTRNYRDKSMQSPRDGRLCYDEESREDKWWIGGPFDVRYSVLLVRYSWHEHRILNTEHRMMKDARARGVRTSTFLLVSNLEQGR